MRGWLSCTVCADLVEWFRPMVAHHCYVFFYGSLGHAKDQGEYWQWWQSSTGSPMDDYFSLEAKGICGWPKMTNELCALCVKADTVDNAVAELNSRGVTQPTLFRVAGVHYVKADHTVIPLTDCVSLADAVELTFMCFHIFHVQDPFELSNFYGFLEQILNIKPSIHSTTFSDLILSLSKKPEN